ncbi:MAG TPA: amino acid adenylation domain-containing protein, partial [Thermoanaerobaculia bacterium]|nr:amino acid adenylation domain-containing protein [Thermoanaerobaculia bacterium]
MDIDNLPDLDELSPEELALFESLLRDEGVDLAADDTIRPRQDCGELPLSFAQQRLWFFHQMDPASTLYNVPMAVRLRGRLDVRALAASLGEIARRHESLRATFTAVAGEPVQAVAPAGRFPLPVFDLRALPGAKREGEVQRLATRERQTPFDLAAGPLLRGALLVLGAEEFVALLNMHHIVSDGWSMGILVRELGTLYGVFSQGRPSPLPDLPIQYADFAAWQRQKLAGESLEAELAYWRERLGSNPPVLELPADRPRPAVQTFRGGRQPVRVPAHLLGGLQEVSRRHDATLFMTLIGAYAALLSRYSGQDDLIIGTPVAGRNHVQIEDLIGFFINTLVLRADLAGEPSFLDLVGRVRETTLSAFAHQDLPFEKLVEELQPKRDLSRSPIFQVAFALQNVPGGALKVPGLTLENLPAESGTAKFDLTLALVETGAGLAGGMEYNRDLFDASRIARMSAHFAALVAGIVEAPERPVSSLPLLTESESSQILLEWNDTEKPCPQVPLVHELFAAHARRQPEATAVAAADGSRLTYGELEARANRLAWHLRGLGVGPEVLVAICTERTLDRVVGIVGALKAGGAYVSLDPTYPKERLTYLLEDAGAPVLLTEERFLPALPETRAQVILLDGQWEGDESRSPESGVTPDNLSYVVYTSGSTGKPKGVQIPHAGLMNLVRWHQDLYGVAPGERGTQIASPAFDASIWELWPYLAGGASLHIPDEETRLSSSGMIRWWAEQGITLAYLMTPLAEGVLEEEVPEGLDLQVRALIIGGDRLHRRPRLEVGFKLMNHYGPAEYTVTSTVVQVPPEGQGSGIPAIPTIGRAVDNTQIYVLDRRQRPAPVGVPGELYVAGIGLARGYHARPDLTAEKFVPDPFSEQPGARMYRTADLVRWLPDGDMDFLGRLDHQVKIRGLRIELGEIESVLGQHPQVREAAVLVREDRPGDKRLTAYIVGGAAVEDLKAFLRERLPEYMVPAAFLLLESLPLTSNGKVDRRALPAPEWAPETSYTAPRTPVEEVLAGLFETVLQSERVGVEDDFFERGGHSLLATRLASRVRETFGIELPVRALFEAPTVAGLAEAISDAMRDDAVRLPAIERIPRDRPLPLSFAQQRLWFLDRLVGSSSLYNVGMAVRLVGPLDVAALSATLGEIVRRHETLRTHFATIDGEPVQVVSPAGAWSLPVVDLRGTADREAEARSLAGMEARLPFDLGRGPLLRATLLALAPEEHVVLLTMHHIISDGWSKDVLVREVMALYRAFAAGRPSPLPELPVQYADFAAWQRRWLQGEPLDRQLAYWKRHLADLAVLDLPADRPRPAVQTFAGANSGLMLTRDLAGLHALGRREGATLFMTLLAAFQSLLHRVTGQTDLALGTPIAGRNQVQTEGLIGFFINTLVLRGDAVGDPTYSELVRRAREAALGAYAHQDLPFEKLVAELQTDRDRSRSPLFQVMFGVQNAAAEGIEIPGLRLEPLGVESGTSKFDLTLTLNESPRGLLGLTEHNRDLFDATTMLRLLRHLGVLVEAAAADPGRRISELPLWTADECQQVLAEWNDTAAAVPDARLHEVVAGWAGRTPEATALIFGDHFVTYGELDRRSNRLARHLQTLGIGHEVPVGLCMERSPELVVGLLGVLKAGGSYLPLDPVYPAERLEHMIGDAGLLVLLTQERLADGLPNFWGFTVRLDSDWETVAVESGGPLAQEVPAQGLAYVIYTSGSTGRAKGVMVSHAGIGNLTAAQARVFHVDAGSRVLQFASPSFDASISEIAVTLAAGATLCMAGRETLMPGPALLDLLRDLGITTVTLPPSALAVLPETELPALHTLVVAGEACPVELARRWSTGRRFVNAYGPTEATVCVTAALFDPESGRLPLGRAIDNTRLFLLDRNHEPVPAGVTGEVYAAGIGLARGYLNRPELTAAAFVPNPFGELGERLYRTGDLGRQLAGGELEFLGRGDHQVKVRGFRIELGEIEAALAEHPSVREAVALAREDNPGEKRLVAYFVPNVLDTDADPSQELREALQARLPDYMVPAFFVALDELPLLPNGKVDRRALPAPERRRAGVEKAYAAPRNRAEEQLAAIWSEILRQERVSIDDNFFELGGDSILGIQAIFRAGQAGLRLTPGQLFEHPTVARLAAVAEVVEAAVAETGLVTGEVLLTPVQRWFFGQELADTHHYNQAVLLEIEGGADPAVLERAFGVLLEHHDALRMRFETSEAGWRQWNEGAMAVPFARIDLAPLPGEALTPAIETAAARLQTNLSPTEGPLQRFALFQAGEGRPDRLLMIVHHLVMDGVSWRILLEDLGTAYRQLAAGSAPALPPRTTSYQRWADRLAGHASSAEVEAQGAYWLERLARPLPRLPLDGQDANSVTSAKTVMVSLDAEETRALLQEVPRAYRTQINDVLLAALAEAFAGWTGSRRLLFDLEGHGREDLFDDVDLSRTVGWFTALYPVILDLEGVTAPSDVLKAAKEQLRAVPGRGIAYGLLRHLADNEAGGRLRRLPEAEVVFNYLGQLDQAVQEGGIFRAARESSGPARSPRQTRPYLFEINAGVRGGRLRMGWIYSEDLHRRATVERLAELFLAALRRLIAHCQSPEAGGYTPSDFPLTRLDQPALDRLLAATGDIEDLYPVSPVQEGMLFHTLLAPRSGVYVGQVSLTLNVDLDVRAFERAWEQVVLHHPILRTGFYWQDLEKPLQVVYRQVALPWERLDLRGLPAAEQKARLVAFLREDRRKGFDPARPPLLGLALIRLEEQSYRFVWSHHHLVLDGWSIPLLLRDLFASYGAAVRGEEPRLGPVRPYRDYIAWLERHDLAAAEAFWRRELAGFAAPTPLGGPAAAAGESGFRHEGLTPARTEELKSFARGLQLTLNTVIQGAWSLLLQRYSGNDDVVFGTVTSGRAAEVPGIEGIVGLFINTLPARVAVPGSAELGSWLRQLQERQAAVRRYEHSPLSQVQGWSEIPRGVPLFESILAFENYPVDDSVREQAGRGFRIGEAEATEQNNFPLTLIAMPGSRLGLRLSYDGRRFDAVSVERMLRHLSLLLEGMTAGADRPLASLPLLSEAERHQLLAEWNDTAALYPGETLLHRWIEAQVERTPEATALVFEGGRLSYREMDDRAGRLARHLRRLGVGPDVPVGICVERSFEMVVGLLAILKAGGAYVPLDPSYPQERLAYMLEDALADAVPPVLLIQPHLVGLLPQAHRSGVVVVGLDADVEADAGGDALPERAGAGNAAYVIYTSGSTGRPKGAINTHQAICNRLLWMQDAYRLTPADRVLQKTPFSFDVSVWELFWPLMTGARLVLARPQGHKDSAYLTALIEEQSVTTLHFVPSMLQVFLEAPELDRCRSLRRVIASGEALPRDLEQRFFERLRPAVPGIELHNLYGPTEAAVDVTFHACQPGEESPSVPIGRPIANVGIFILDAEYRAVPLGVAGELLIGGAGLARGYLRRPDLTAEKFVPHPSAVEPGERLYRTGDLARHLPS